MGGKEKDARLGMKEKTHYPDGRQVLFEEQLAPRKLSVQKKTNGKMGIVAPTIDFLHLHHKDFRIF